MKDHDRRVPASHLKIAEETIKRRLRGMDYNLYKRVSANIGVYTKGNEQRMGKGKGKFDYWACRIPVSRIVFELKGNLHEKVAREAFRLAAHKLPGTFNVNPQLSLLHAETIYTDAELVLRTLGVCEERRPASRRPDETGQRRHTGEPQATTETSAPRRGKVS